MDNHEMTHVLDQARDIITLAVKKLGKTLVDNYHSFNRQEVEMKSPHEIVTK